MDYTFFIWFSGCQSWLNVSPFEIAKHALTMISEIENLKILVKETFSPL